MKNKIINSRPKRPYLQKLYKRIMRKEKVNTLLKAMRQTAYIYKLKAKEETNISLIVPGLAATPCSFSSAAPLSGYNEIGIFLADTSLSCFRKFTVLCIS